jgi:hypothetical protein
VTDVVVRISVGTLVQAFPHNEVSISTGRRDIKQFKTFEAKTATKEVKWNKALELSRYPQTPFQVARITPK